MISAFQSLIVSVVNVVPAEKALFKTLSKFDQLLTNRTTMVNIINGQSVFAEIG
jgi:hypothetical protein